MRTARYLTAAAILALVAGTARAADASAEQAARLERDIAAWLADTLGPGLKVPVRPVQLEPAGEGYRLTAPLGGGVPALTATLREAEGGTWALRDVRLPSPARFGVELPEPGGAPGATVRTEYFVRLGEQDVSALLDPSYLTPSTTARSFRDVELRTTSGGEEQTTRIARYAGQSALRPTGDGRVDVVSDGTAEGYASASTLPNGLPLRVEIEQLRSHSELSGVSRERVPRLLQAGLQLAGGALTADADGTAAPANLRLLRALVEAVQELASSGQGEQVAQGLRVRVGESGGFADRAQVGFGVTTPGGVLTLRMDLAAEGIQAPDMPLSPAQRSLLPQRIALRPAVSGAATADLIRLALDATDPDDPQAPDLARLFSRGGLTAGLESFALELGGASFSGSARVVVRTPAAVGGEGQVTATGFEALLDRIKAVPEFAGALPLLAFAKGIARPVGDRLVWGITYRDGRVLVNDVDMSAMAGGGRR